MFNRNFLPQLAIFAVSAFSVVSPASSASPTPGTLTNVLQPTSIVETKSGPLQGVDDGEIQAWLGIPYAKPPVDELRWSAPVEIQPWKETRIADQPGSACAQGAELSVFATPGGSEDCLYLNVYADRQAVNRAKANGEALPVFVWIHGGGLHVGQADDNNPRALVKDGKAIVVSMNYRLGVFGFFAHPAIDAPGKQPKASYGSMDQTLALRWVQENIEAFGGNPKDVTIAGESAGGNSVLTQILSPYAKGLFRNAIEMSGATVLLKDGNYGATLSLERARQIGLGFASAVGCADADTAARCLRGLSTGAIIANQSNHLLLKTVIDGDYLPDAPGELFRSGNFNRVRLVSGNTRDEGDFFAALPEIETGQPMTNTSYPKAIEKMFGPLAPEVLKVYPVDNYLNASKAYSAAAGDFLFACPSNRLKELAAQHTDVWAYEFADRTAPSYTPALSFDIEAGHTSELPYLFEGFHGGARGMSVQLNPMQDRLAEKMKRYWTTVSQADGWSDWPKFIASEGKVMRFQLPDGDLITSSRFKQDHHCDFWDRQGIY